MMGKEERDQVVVGRDHRAVEAERHQVLQMAGDRQVKDVQLLRVDGPLQLLGVAEDRVRAVQLVPEPAFQRRQGGDGDPGRRRDLRQEGAEVGVLAAEQDDLVPGAEAQDLPGAAAGYSVRCRGGW